MNTWLGSRSKPVRAIIIVLALLFILLEWITRVLAGSIHYLINKFGLKGFEDWLRGLPLWCVAPITLIVIGVYGLFEFGQFMFIAKHLYLLAVIMHLLKWAMFPVLSYVWRLYDQRLLQYAWVRWVYHIIMYVHNLVVDWVHQQDFYKKAIELKNSIKEGIINSFRQWRKRRRIGRVRIAMRFLRRGRH